MKGLNKGQPQAVQTGRVEHWQLCGAFQKCNSVHGFKTTWEEEQ